MAEVPLPPKDERDKSIYNVRTGEKVGEERWNELQKRLFRSDMEGLLSQVGFTVRPWQDGDPSSFYGRSGELTAVKEEGEGALYVVMNPRQPNNSDIAMYHGEEGGEVKRITGNHDMTASEFLDSLRHTMAQGSTDPLEGVKGSEEYQRLRNWVRYQDMEL